MSCVRIGLLRGLSSSLYRRPCSFSSLAFHSKKYLAYTQSIPKPLGQNAYPLRLTTPSDHIHFLVKVNTRPFSVQRRNRFPSLLDKIPSKFIVNIILALNGVVFTLWIFASTDNSAAQWLFDNFTSSWRNFKAGRIWTLITSCFSHMDISHFAFNCVTFYFMAPFVAQMLGTSQFVLLYMGGGLLSSLVSLMYARFITYRDRNSLGASGAIYSVVSYLACAQPKMTFQLYFFIPLQAWMVVTGLLAYDTYSALYNKSGTTDSVGHVAGIIAGFLYFVARRGRI